MLHNFACLWIVHYWSNSKVKILILHDLSGLFSCFFLVYFWYFYVLNGTFWSSAHTLHGITSFTISFVVGHKSSTLSKNRTQKTILVYIFSQNYQLQIVNVYTCIPFYLELFENPFPVRTPFSNSIMPLLYAIHMTYEVLHMTMPLIYVT